MQLSCAHTAGTISPIALAPEFIEQDADEGKTPKTRLDWPAEFKDEVLARLLALNAERAAAERAAGVRPSRKMRSDRRRRGRANAVSARPANYGLRHLSGWPHLGLANPLNENVRAALLRPVNRFRLRRQNGAGPLRAWLANRIIAFAGATLDEIPAYPSWEPPWVKGRPTRPLERKIILQYAISQDYMHPGRLS